MNDLPPTWAAPGPGSWSLLADHYPRPVTASLEGFCALWSATSTEWMQRSGLPVVAARMVAVNGLPYVSIDTGGGSRTPPAWLMRLLVHVVPSLRRSERTLRRAIAQRPWVAAVERWYATDRPIALSRMKALSAQAPDGLGDDALALHLRACVDEVDRSARQHLALHEHDAAPPGLFAAQAERWGIPVGEAIGLLAGSSPASAAAGDELARLRAAVAGRRAVDLDALRRLGPEVADALDAYLATHGDRVIDGYDIDSLTLREAPSVLLALATAPAPPVRHDGHAVARLRERVPAPEREGFDRMLRDARLAYGVRDDNGGILVAWPTGLLRRAMLAAGRRLSAAGRLTDPALAIEAYPAEVIDALTAGASIDEAALRARAARRASVRASDAPRTLGPPPSPAPKGLGGALGLAMRAFEVFDMMAEPPGGGTPDGHAVSGPAASAPAGRALGIGATPYTGTARILDGGGRGFDGFQPGDVVVAPMTSPSYNVVLVLAGALVTEEGGLMSHAAIMARELGLPAVLGVAGATTWLRDGDPVVVDPVAGTVRPAGDHIGTGA